MSDSTQVGRDVDAVLAGMRRPPPQVDPNYQPPMPTAIQPRSPPASAFGPGAFGSAQQGQWPNQAPGAYGNAPPPPPPRTAEQDAGSGLTPSPYSNQPPAQPPQPTPPQPQQGTDPRSRPPDEYRLGQPVWHPRPGEQGYQEASNRPVSPPPPRFQQGNQPGPWPAAFANSPTIDPRNAPALPGETPQETADLNRHMGHESQGRNIMNDAAAKNPALYYDPKNPRTCQGYWQIVNSTWRDGAQKAGVDLRQWPTAMSAPYQVQRQVALALYRAYGNKPWEPQPGAGERGDRFALRPQDGLSPYPRGSNEWGQPVADYQDAPSRDFGPMGQPRSPQNTIAHVMGAFAPLLVGIASLALRLPLSTAITAYGAMARAQDNGQREDYERNRTRYQDQLKEATAQQTMESRDASDAFAQYGNNNPVGLQQALAQIALKYNDPAMYHMAEAGHLNDIHKLQTQRDMLNQGLLKGSKAADEERDRQAQDAAAKAMYRQWHDKFVQDNGREPTAEESAIEYNRDIGEAARAGTKDPKADSTAEDATPYNVFDTTTGQQTRQVRLNRNGGVSDLNGKPTQLGPNEKLGDKVGAKPGADPNKPDEMEPSDYDVINTDTGKPTGQKVRVGKHGGVYDYAGNRITLQPNEQPQRAPTRTGQPALEPFQAPETWEGAPNRPPPGADPAAWPLAIDWVIRGTEPVGMRYLGTGMAAKVANLLPVAQRVLGITPEEEAFQKGKIDALNIAQTNTERYFTGGQGAAQMRSMNTVAEHLDLFRQYAEALQNNAPVQTVNALKNRLAASLEGRPEVPDFHTAQVLMMDEVVRLLTNTGGTRYDREDAQKLVNDAMSGEQLAGVADTLQNFLKGKFVSLQREFVQGGWPGSGMPSYDNKMWNQRGQWFTSMLLPSAQGILNAPNLPVPGAEPDRATPLPTWATDSGTAPDGRFVYRGKDGQTYNPDHTPYHPASP